MSWRTEKFLTIYWFAQLWQGGGEKAEPQPGPLERGAGLGAFTARTQPAETQVAAPLERRILPVWPLLWEISQQPRQILLLKLCSLSSPHRTAQQNLCAAAVPSVWSESLTLKGTVHCWGASFF